MARKRKYVMTAPRRAALRKAQLASARKRRRHGATYQAKRNVSQTVGLMMAGARLHTTARARRH